jgi:hypothetical protein
MADDPTPGTPEGVHTAEDTAPTGRTPAAIPADTLPPASPVTPPDTGYTAGGVPTLDGVREKIETRYGTALGATELAEDTTEGRTAAQRYEARQHAAADKLEEIRASMRQKD